MVKSQFKKSDENRVRFFKYFDRKEVSDETVTIFSETASNMGGGKKSDLEYALQIGYAHAGPLFRLKLEFLFFACTMKRRRIFRKN